MIPAVVAVEVVHALRDFLITGLKPSIQELADVIEDFFDAPGNLTQGPYLSLALPFLNGLMLRQDKPWRDTIP